MTTPSSADTAAATQMHSQKLHTWPYSGEPRTGEFRSPMA
jgi:hypothetical protein